MELDIWFAHYYPYQYLEFSASYGQTDRIIVSAQVTSTGRIFKGVFDNTSYLLIGISIVAITFCTSYLLDIDLGLAFIYTWKILVKQDLGEHKVHDWHTTAFKTFETIESVALSFLSMMYYSIVFSIFLVEENVQQIDSFDDLVNTYTDKKIYIERSDALFQRSKYYELMKDRVLTWDYGDNYLKDQIEIHTNVHKNTHVMLRARDYIDRDYTVFPDWFKCQYPKRNYYYSKNVFETNAYIHFFQRGFPHLEIFNNVRFTQSVMSVT